MMDYPKIENFMKKHSYLICIDSDGTAMDAMNVKHKKCFGPCFVAEWGLEEHSDEVQIIWNEVNLYSSTRGFNRFITFMEVLKRIDGNYLNVAGNELQDLVAWVKSAAELSNKCLKQEIEKNDCAILNKTLQWSLAVNQEIAKLTADDNKPFDGVRECLEAAYEKVDISVISSANMSAIVEEWGRYGLLKYVGAMTSQEIGTKGECITKMLQKGYDPEHVLMIGDAFPDVDAARECGVFFYPIIADQEQQCWTALKEFYLEEFISGNMKKHQEQLLQKFNSNFNK